MLLEVKVWGSKEWYEQGAPALEALGFVAREDLGGADPETDGELITLFFELQKPVVAETLAKTLHTIRTTVLAGEAPQIDIAFVPNR